ncbi:MAG: CpaF family protein [Acidimicrobiales bacterium]
MKLSEKLATMKESPAEEIVEPDALAGPAPEKHPARRATVSAPRRNSAKRGESEAWIDSKRKVHQLVLAEVAPKMGKLSANALATEVRSSVDRILAREDIGVSPIERRRFVQEVIQDTLGYGPLDPMLRDAEITEIMCNSFEEIWVERAGRISRTEASFADENHYRQVIDKIVSAVGRRVDEASPMVDARLPDGSRVNAIIPPLSIHGPILTIRKFSATPLTAADLINLETLSMDLSLFLEACVRGKINILVSGGTGTGKTTLLNVLSAFIPEEERVITIEDSAELQLQQPHVVNLEARPPNAEGSGEVRIRDLVKNSLRMRPDRILVGECRGAETLDMLQAMNTGHEGSMTTVHSNSPRESLSRLETMVLMAGFELPIRAIREQIASALDLIVQLERAPSGARIVTSVAEVQGMEGDVILLQQIFTRQSWSSDNPGGAGEVVPMGLRPKLVDRLALKGIDIPASTFQSNRSGAIPLVGTNGRSTVGRPSRVRVPTSKGLGTKARGR